MIYIPPPILDHSMNLIVMGIVLIIYCIFVGHMIIYLYTEYTKFINKKHHKLDVSHFLNILNFNIRIYQSTPEVERIMSEITDILTSIHQTMDKFYVKFQDPSITEYDTELMQLLNEVISTCYHIYSSKIYMEENINDKRQLDQITMNQYCMICEKIYQQNKKFKELHNKRTHIEQCRITIYARLFSIIEMLNDMIDIK